MIWPQLIVLGWSLYTSYDRHVRVIYPSNYCVVCLLPCTEDWLVCQCSTAM